MEDNYKIQTLIETCDFEWLAADEKNFLLQQITREEYEERRKLITSTRAVFEQQATTIKPDPAIKLLIAARMAAQKKAQRAGILRQLTGYAIPAYIPAMAIMLLLIILPLLYSHSKARWVAQTAQQPQIIYKTKIVTVEKEVPRYVNVPIIKYVDRKTTAPAKEVKPSLPAGMAVSDEHEVIPPTALVTFNVQQWQQQKNNIGLPTIEEQDLNKFMVVAR